MNENKRIWIVNQFANTPQMPGGTRHFEIASFLVKKGWKVEIFASDFNLSKRKSLKLEKLKFNKTENINGIIFHWLKTFPYRKNDWKRYLNLLSFCFNFSIYQFRLFPKKHKNKLMPDLIIASSPQLIVSFCALILAKILKKYFIFEVRDLWPQVLIDLGGMSSNNLIIKALNFMGNILYKNADCVVVLAEGLQDYVINKGAKKVVWLPNGPDLEKFSPLSKRKFSHFFTKSNPFKLVYAGAHGVANDLGNVIEAAKSLLDYPIKIILIGDGPEKKDLIYKAKDLDNVLFKDPLPKELIPEILVSADAILISLGDVKLFQYGISPNKLYDAYALQRPVVSTLKGSVNNEIHKYQVGIGCEPESPQLLANSIIKMYKKSNKERELMGIKGRKLAETIYSRNIINNKYFDLMNSLFDNNGKF